MSSAVEICNRALIKLGAATITSLLDSRNEARICNVLYDQIRKELLRSHPWNFAMERAVLASDTELPAFGFFYKYALPADCLLVWDLYENNSDEYRVEGRYLFSNDTAVNLIYVKDVTDAALFDPLFTSLLVAKIALEASYVLTGAQTVGDNLIKEYQLLERRAKTQDGKENPAIQLPNGLWSDGWDNL